MPLVKGKQSGNHRKLILIAGLTLILALGAGCQNSGSLQENLVPKAARKGKWVTVARVVDGDTFVTDNRVRIRLIGVDTPESTKRHDPYGREAAEFTRSRLSGQEVRLEYDVDRTDKYGRTLAYVFLPDGVFFNALLVEEGYARIMTVPPNVKYAKKFLALERQARQEDRGLWRQR